MIKSLKKSILEGFIRKAESLLLLTGSPLNIEMPLNYYQFFTYVAKLLIILHSSQLITGLLFILAAYCTCKFLYLPTSTNAYAICGQSYFCNFLLL